MLAEFKSPFPDAQYDSERVGNGLAFVLSIVGRAGLEKFDPTNFDLYDSEICVAGQLLPDGWSFFDQLYWDSFDDRADWLEDHAFLPGPNQEARENEWRWQIAAYLKYD